MKLTSIRSFFREMSREGKILLDPAGEIEMPKEERVIGYRALKAEEIKKIMNAADVREAMGYRDRVIMELLYTSGIRVSELIKIKLEDVKLEEGTLVIVIDGRNVGRERKDNCSIQSGFRLSLPYCLCLISRHRCF